MINTNVEAKSVDFSFIGWKAYNNIKKKAMEQEFSWSGLLLSLSIAFFVVLLSAQILNTAYLSMENTKNNTNSYDRFYRLESASHINFQAKNLKNIPGIKMAVVAEFDYQGEADRFLI